jgi:nucleoside-diphosphate-sugar epimerase|tara:strand:+ start:3346 stop:3585 length:240 start_codon:yes stop_codon:yes gene_type:complete
MIKRPRALITGASGFIGSHLLFDLIDLNFEVLAISRSKGPDLGKNLTWMSADISSLESLLTTKLKDLSKNKESLSINIL